MILLADHFQRDDSRRHSEWLRQQKWFIKAKQEQERREKIEEKLDDDLASLAADVVMATEIQIQKFEMKLNSYDERVVTALMKNQELLDRLQAEREALVDQAYVMDDGRRVFKSEDGSFVIDEFGELVSPDEFDPNIIPDHFPNADAINRLDSTIDRATEVKGRLHTLDTKLDGARDEAADGEISVERIEEVTAEFEDEFGALDAELDDLIAPSQRDHAPAASAFGTSSTLSSTFSRMADADLPLPRKVTEQASRPDGIALDTGMNLQ